MNTLRELFQELADLPAEERRRRLDERQVSPELRAELASLLDHDATASRSLTGVADAARHAFADALPVDSCGPYKLVRLLGAGGMGSVYLAERDDGEVRQRVAVKLMHAGLARPDWRDRFLRERQMLASLEHPNIARLLDAGTLPNGTPYFAMEYCEGEPIDVYCERMQLSSAGVLRLLIPVCEAVHYAHQRMIVHRDIKPSNIMITGDGTPKLLDFGIAKAIDETQIEQTQTGARLMTFHFASPEHIRGEMVSAASDVFSLGAVAYRLLTGHYPRETADSGAGLPLMLDREPLALRHWVPGIASDIENIVMMALRREPERRYPSADALGADIRRFLDLRPVMATPPSFAYRAKRFLQRNPAATGATLFAAVSIAIGTSVALYESRQASQRMGDVQQMANVLLFDFEQSIKDIPGTLEARLKAVQTAREYLEKIGPLAGNDPGLQRKLADAYTMLADIQYATNLSRQGAEAATVSLTASAKIRRALGDVESTDPKRVLAFVETMAMLCSRSTTVGNMDAAKAACAEARSIASAWLDREPDSEQAMMAAQAAEMRNGLMLEADGQAGAAREAKTKSFEYAVALAKRRPNDDKYQAALCRAGRVLADMHLAMKDAKAAVSPSQAAVEAGETLVRQNPRSVSSRHDLATALHVAGSVARALGGPHLATASAHLERAVRLSREAVEMDKANESAKDSIVVGLHRLASVRRNQHRYPDALALYSEARSIIDAKVKTDPSRRNLYLMGNNWVNTASAELEAGDKAAATKAFEESSRWLRRTLQVEANDAVTRENLVSAQMSLAEIAEGRKDAAAARRHWQEAWQTAQAMVARDAAAKRYLTDYPKIEAMGKRLGELR